MFPVFSPPTLTGTIPCATIRAPKGETESVLFQSIGKCKGIISPIGKEKRRATSDRKQLSVLFVFSRLAAKVSVGLAVGSRKRNLVDPRGVEPLSENPLGRLSSWAVCYEVLPGGAQTDTRHRDGSPFLDDRLKDETPMHLPC